ncbi:COPA/B second beta-propeller domain-containing protein [Caenorhabditis elegans]|uniref:COPA/B second beta-propeller domain-containing protein n=1 Tax=Caenorhabditis elegans TaxID=6239 RepID=O17742_CAEEL|nr:Coatomer WD associated region domain-containing protein [Caenorhabditis elegans]CAB04024.1 Coatomer WD associated region domain-containing protein [Caenorhabditis elegans]|eukprot:NP_493151.1 Uncharacterized protein CELE_E03H4.8 [Caenorhabditis elegans]
MDHPVQLSIENPAVSMDSTGQILWAVQSEIQAVYLRSLFEQKEANDGERLTLSVKNLGSSEISPQTLAHSSNGHFFMACGDGKYIVYTYKQYDAIALKIRHYGQGLEFVWAAHPNMFAVRESATNVKIKKNFKDHKSIRSDMMLEGISGGPLLALRSNDSLCFFDWESAALVRRIEITSKSVYWSDNREMVAICGDDSFYVFKYSAEAVANATEVTEDGIEDAFKVIGEQAEAVETGFWIGDCFIFTTALTINRINHYAGGEIVTVAHVDRPLCLLGYMAEDSRVYAVDKDLNVISYELFQSDLEYQTATMRRDIGTRGGPQICRICRLPSSANLPNLPSTANFKKVDLPNLPSSANFEICRTQYNFD